MKKSFRDVVVFIPALKKTVAFQDDLVKKLAGITLIQRAINKSKELGVDDKNIHLVTDSEEIRLIAERNHIQSYWDPYLSWNANNIDRNLFRYICKASVLTENILLLSPYTPLMDVRCINKAMEAFNSCKKDILKPVKQEKLYVINGGAHDLHQMVFGGGDEVHQVVSNAFTLMKSNAVKKWRKESLTIHPWNMDEDVFVISSFQDWWVCEKLLQRKRIVFRVIGNEQVGMGHIYRALSLAHEVTDHEILFVSDATNRVAVNELTGYDYWLGIYNKKNVVKEIIALQPDLVINDILDTDVSDVFPLKENGIRVVNFEDLGEGVEFADIVINELFDEPQIEGDNILWGMKYFFVRDEFYEATPNEFNESVESILLSFGGTDQHDLSSKIYHSIKSLCYERGIHINIVTGPAYAGYKDLQKETEEDDLVTLTHATGVISRIMEKTQLAITSNGRTIYELAYMNIPSIVVPLHDREDTHSFGSEDNGFAMMDIYKEGKTEREIVPCLLNLLENTSYRQKLYDRTTNFCFNSNKQHVIDLIQDLLQ